MAFIGVVNASTLFIETDNESLWQGLYDSLRYKEPTFQTNKWSKWDGTVRMFNKKNGTFPSGLLSTVLKMCIEYGEKYELEPMLKTLVRDIKKEDIQDWTDNLKVSSGGIEIKPYDYQVEALYYSIKYTRYLALAATSAGKSLIQYLTARFWLEMMGDEGKILIVVPTLQLVTQLAKDFEDYSQLNGWDSNSFVHTAGDGVSPYTRKRIVICTWQTLKNQDRDFFQPFNFLIGDEAHTFSSECLEYISNSCINCWQRMGLTGTLRRNDPDHKIRVSKIFGDVKRLVTTKQLQDRGLATKTIVNMIVLSYPTELRRKWRSDPVLEKETKILCGYEPRNNVLVNLGKKLKGNSLFLFNNIETHLEVVKDSMIAAGLKPFVIHGDVSVEEREEIKRHIETNDNVVLLASYGTTSTGISIKKLHNLVFAYPRKSNISIQQSIGRMLRLHDSKDISYIYDIVDELKYDGRINRAMDWAAERLDLYREEGQDIRAIRKEI